MKKAKILTSYEEILNKIETMSVHNYDINLYHSGIVAVSTVIDETKGGHISLEITNSKIQQIYMESLESSNLPVEQKRSYLIKHTLKNGILFDSHDIILYRILFSHYLQSSTNGYSIITLDEIHNYYRDKCFMYKKGKDKYDSQTFRAYVKSFLKLSTMELTVDFANSVSKSFGYYKEEGKYIFRQKMIQLERDVNGDYIAYEKIKYSLGSFGEYLARFRHYGEYLPTKIYQINYNQIDILNMGIYISRMLFMNKRTRSYYTLYVSTLLSRIMKYDKLGITTSDTMLEYLGRIDANKRSKKIKILEQQIKYILEALITAGRIKSYKLSNKFTYKNINDNELSIKIVYNKN